jgi:predicted CXXCH cytochrome family protein
MSKTRFAVGIAAVLGFVFAWSSSMAQSIRGTDHDLSGRGWGSTELCIFCHTPHNARAVTGAPLWNHATIAATFTLYSSASMNATTAQPGPTSKLCLSCHDGTVAIDSFGTRTGTNFMTGGALVGTDLGNDHPIGFAYNAALATADGGLVTPASASAVVPGVPLFASQMECATCHNVHSNANAGFLRKSNAASALCLTCHTK